MELTTPLTQIVVLFGAALVVAWLLRLLRAPAIIGFLSAGIVLGPSALDLLRAAEVHFFAELGLVLLLFSVGLELSAEPLLRIGRRVLVAGGLQMAGTALLAFLLIEVFQPMSATAAVVLGFACALSSTAIVLKQLAEREQTESPAGTLAVGILLIQDVAVILAMMLLPLLTGAAAGWQMVAQQAGLAVAGLVILTLLARRIMPLLAGYVFRHGGQEFLTLFAVVTACVGAWLAGWAGWSWPLGAFIAGLVLGQTNLRHQLNAEITPFRDVFNALFFVSIGMLVDLRSLAGGLAFIAVAVAVLLLVKAVIAASSIILAGWPLRPALTAGLGLCSVSEFGFVLAREASRLGVLPPDVLDQFVAVSVGSMLLGALFVPLAEPLAERLSARLSSPSRPTPATTQAGRPAELSDHVVIVGYGLNGQNLAGTLKATAIPHIVIEMNRSRIHAAEQHGLRLLVGDATRRAILQQAGLANARALVVLINDPPATRRIVAQARAMRPDLYILARTRYVAELEPLYRLGARQVIPEEFETSIEIFAHVLKEFGVPDNVIEQQVNVVRAGRYAMLRGRPADRAARLEWLQALEAALTQTFLLLDESPVCGRTIRELDLRARSGATIVALTRGGRPIANPPPELKLQPGDVLVLVGTHKQLHEARLLLAPTAEQPADAAQLSSSG